MVEIRHLSIKVCLVGLDLDWLLARWQYLMHLWYERDYFVAYGEIGMLVLNKVRLDFEMIELLLTDRILKVYVPNILDDSLAMAIL